MIKIIGALLLTAGTALWGINGGKRLKDRASSLSTLTTAIEIMGYELCDRLTPVPELFELMKGQTPRPVCELFRNAEARMREIGAVPFSALWRQAVTDTELMLTKEEKQTLSELGYSLGKYDVDEQRSAIETARRKFEEYKKRAEEERDKNWKAQTFLGIAAGLFAVIILL